MTPVNDRDASTASPELDDEDDDSSASAGEIPQVSSYIAIIRIVAVLGMGLCVSFGLFIMLVGLKGVIVGIPIILLAIPCYYGMQLAERLATRETNRRDAASAEDG
jgi:hypothetical protein